MCSALNYLEVALDDLNVFSPNVRHLKAVNRKYLSHAHVYRLAEVNDVWRNRLLCSRGDCDRNGPIYCNVALQLQESRLRTSPRIRSHRLLRRRPCSINR